MINFDVRRGYIQDKYKDIRLTCNGTTIQLGLLDKGEVLELAERLRDAAYDIDDVSRDKYISQRDEFMATIKSMWVNMGRSENSWDAVHDWQYYFMLCGYRADGAVESFNDALQCE